MSQYGAVVSEHRAAPRARRAGVVLLGAVASTVLAVGALNGAGAANATCLSVSGLSIGTGCTSTFGNIAVGIGKDAFASATKGLFGTAFAVGNASASTVGSVNIAVALGPGSSATVESGVANVSIAAGNETTARTSGLGNAAIGASVQPAFNPYWESHGFPAPFGGDANAHGTLSHALSLGAGAYSTTTGTANTVATVGTGSTTFLTSSPFKVAVTIGKNKTTQK